MAGRKVDPSTDDNESIFRCDYVSLALFPGLLVDELIRILEFLGISCLHALIVLLFQFCYNCCLLLDLVYYIHVYSVGGGGGGGGRGSIHLHALPLSLALQTLASLACELEDLVHFEY